MRAPSLSELLGERGEPVGLLAPQVGDPAQPGGGVGEKRDGGQGRNDLPVVAEVEVGAVKARRAGDFELTLGGHLAGAAERLQQLGQQPPGLRGAGGPIRRAAPARR